MKVAKNDQQPSKLTRRPGSQESDLEKTCMNCGFTMPYNHDCECLLQIGKDMRKKLKRWRERMDLEATEVEKEKRPAKQDAQLAGPKQGGLF